MWVLGYKSLKRHRSVKTSREGVTENRTGSEWVTHKSFVLYSSSNFYNTKKRRSKPGDFVGTGICNWSYDLPTISTYLFSTQLSRLRWDMVILGSWNGVYVIIRVISTQLGRFMSIGGRLGTSTFFSNHKIKRNTVMQKRTKCYNDFGIH